MFAADESAGHSGKRVGGTHSGSAVRPLRKPVDSTPAGGRDLSMSPYVAGALSYLPLAGPVFLSLEKKNGYVRFHAYQSLFFATVALVCVGGGLALFAVLPVVYGAPGALAVLFVAMWLVLLVSVDLILMFRAYAGESCDLPLLGDMARRHTGQEGFKAA